MSTKKRKYTRRALVVDPVAEKTKRQIWERTIEVLESLDFSLLVINSQRLKKGTAWPVAAYATLCLSAIRTAARKAKQP